MSKKSLRASKACDQMRLLVIDLPETNPERNLQIEDELNGINNHYFIVRFWVNSRCVILGKFQKHIYEINSNFLKKNAIEYFYRNTGGGTVYQDEGNLNITFAKPLNVELPKAKGRKTSQVITECIRRSIEKEGLQFTVSERNAIYYNEKKMLGSAVSMTKGKFLYHASLLVNANLENLHNSLNWQPAYPETDKKLVKSHRDPVINLSAIYPVTIGKVKQYFLNEIIEFIQPQQTIHINKWDELKDFI
ncbi:lipoate--protein ligase family protein [candidate division KSB1 bacterium]|nr:lipoate--protein ligase family protein [candidate division KSB1 bacterium]